MGATEFSGKSILICVAHQDDETLFCGGLLTALRGQADVNIACFFRPAPGRKDTDTRCDAMARVCADVGARYLQYPFAVEPEHKRLRRHISLSNEPAHIRERPRRPIPEHPLYAVLNAAALGAIRAYQPDVLITHNSVGEYGHREHILLHHAVIAAAATAGVGQTYVFGHGLQEGGVRVDYNIAAKNRLFQHYLPQWDGVALYDFALKDERFIPV